MNATKQTRELKMQHWAEVIHECKNSGMSARQWMQENGIHKHQFYYWQRQLRTKTLQTISNDTSSQPVHPLVEITQLTETQAATSDTVADESLPFSFCIAHFEIIRQQSDYTDNEKTIKSIASPHFLCYGEEKQKGFSFRRCSPLSYVEFSTKFPAFNN